MAGWVGPLAHLILSYLAGLGGFVRWVSLLTPHIHSLDVSANSPRVSVLIHYLWVCPPTAQVCALWFVSANCPLSLQGVFANHPIMPVRVCCYQPCSLLSQGAPSVHSPIYCQVCLIIICALVSKFVVNCLLFVSRLRAVCQPTVGLCWPTVGCLLTDRYCNVLAPLGD